MLFRSVVTGVTVVNVVNVAAVVAVVACRTVHCTDAASVCIPAVALPIDRAMVKVLIPISFVMFLILMLQFNIFYTFL